MTLALLPVLIVVAIDLVCWALVARRLDRDTGGGDPIGGLVAHWRDGADDYVYVWIGWTVACLFIVVGGGTLANAAFLIEPFQLINAINYCFVVPILATTYLLLLRSISAFPVGESTRPIARHFRHGVIVAATALILYSAVSSELSSPSPGSPWVTACTAPCNPALPSPGSPWVTVCTAPCNPALTAQGVAFYVMRGVDTSLALGLFCAILLAFHRRGQRFVGGSLVDEEYPGLGPTRKLVRLGTALLLVAAFASIVTFLHGAALFVHASEILADKNLTQALQAQNVSNLFFKSTWAVWLVITLVASVLCVVVVVWLREKVIGELRTKRRVDELLLRLPEAPLLSTSSASSSSLLEVQKLRLEIQDKIAARYAKAQTWPLPDHAGLAVIVAVVSQVGNLLFGVAGIALSK